MFQNFNAMRMYLTSYFKSTKDADIGLLLSGLKLSNAHNNWKENLETWDAAAWDDWMDGVNKTLKDLNIHKDPKHIKYNELIAFLCMKNYLQLFYNQIAFQGVGNILQIINKTTPLSNNKEWQHWLNCVDESIKQETNIIA